MHYVTRPSGRGLCLPDTRARCECTKEQTAMRNSSTRQAHHSDTNGCLCRRRCTVVHVARQPCPRPISEPSYIHAHGRPPPPRRPGVALIDIQAAMAHRGASGCTLAGMRATGRLARVEPGVCAPHSTPAQHRQRLATPRPGTTARDRRAALRASQRHAVRPQAGRAPGAIVPVPDRCPSKDPGRRGILWPPLYTVKWTREHIPIVFFTERHHSDRSALGLTGSYETGRIDQAEVHSSGPTPFLCGLV